MKSPAGDFRRLRDLASVTRALFFVGFGLDVLSLLVFEKVRPWSAIDGGVTSSFRFGYNRAELCLTVASIGALALTLRRAMHNARLFAPPDNTLRDWSLSFLRPWNPAGRRALHWLWKCSVPGATSGEPPITLRLLWWLWSCWLPTDLVFGVYSAMSQRQSILLAYPAVAIVSTHATLAVCVVIVLGALAEHQDSFSRSALTESASAPDLEKPPRAPPGAQAVAALA